MGFLVDPRTIDAYLHYVEVVAERYKGKVEYWLTFNEINTLEHGGFMGAGVPSTDPKNWRWRRSISFWRALRR